MVNSSVHEFALSLATAIEKTIESGNACFDELVESYPNLGDARNVDDSELNAAFNLATTYLDSVIHGVGFVDHDVPVDVAKQLLLDWIRYVRTGEGQLDPLFLKMEYRHHPNKYWPPN